MPKTLLLADDSVTIQKVVGISFANEDVRIVTVDNGDDAVVRAKEIRPDIVLADVVMPGKSGYDVCAALKADPALAGVPVLLLTGTFETFDEQRAARVGADGHITKPFEAQALVALVNARLASGAAAKPAAAGAASALSAEPEPFDFLEPELTPSRRPKGGTARPVASLSPEGFAFEAEPLEELQLETEDDDADLGNEATAARTALLLDEDGEDAFAVAETAPPVAPARAPTFDDANAVTHLVVEDAPARPAAAPAGFADAGDPLADIEAAADPFAETSSRREEWDVSSDELDDSYSTRVLAPAEASPAPPAPEPAFTTEPLFDEEEAAAEFDLATEVALEPSAPAPRAEREPLAELDDVAPSAVHEPLAGVTREALPAAGGVALSGAMRDQLHETLEKIAWEALGDLSERIVREAVARIEQVAWDVFPRLAETLIREEIRRLKGEE